jgi:hypothetical protein
MVFEQDDIDMPPLLRLFDLSNIGIKLLDLTSKRGSFCAQDKLMYVLFLHCRHLTD